MEQFIVIFVCFSLWTGVQGDYVYDRVRLEQYCGQPFNLMCPDGGNTAGRAGTSMFYVVPIENCSVSVQTPNGCNVNHAVYFNIQKSDLAMGDSLEIYENVQPGNKGILIKKIPGGASPRNQEPDSVAQLLTSYANQQRLSFNLYLEPKDMTIYSHEVFFDYTIVRKQSQVQPSEGCCRALDGYIPTDIICTESDTYGRINCRMTYVPALGITNRAFLQQSCIRTATTNASWRPTGSYTQRTFLPYGYSTPASGVAQSYEGSDQANHIDQGAAELKKLSIGALFLMLLIGILLCVILVLFLMRMAGKTLPSVGPYKKADGSDKFGGSHHSFDSDSA